METQEFKIGLFGQRRHPDIPDGFEAVHTWFGLTYSNYLVLHRTLLQSMPDEWQERFVKCLLELREAFAHVEIPDAYLVQARDDDGKFVVDPIPHYNRGRVRVEPHYRRWEEFMVE